MADAGDPQSDLDAALAELTSSDKLSAPDALGLVANILDYAVDASAQTTDEGARLYRRVSEGFREAATDASPDAQAALTALSEFWSGVADEREASMTSTPPFEEVDPGAWSIDFEHSHRTELRFRYHSDDTSWSLGTESGRGIEPRRPSPAEPTLTQDELRRKGDR